MRIRLVHLPYHGGVIGRVEHAVKLQQLAHVFKPKRRLGMTKPPQHTLDASVDVPDRLSGKNTVPSQNLLPPVISVR